jgi:hypothetical protein
LGSERVDWLHLVTRLGATAQPAIRRRTDAPADVP